MTDSPARNGPPGDLMRFFNVPPPRRCWFCQAPEPRGSDKLGGPDGARISVCAKGEGCRDDRIWHGPAAKSHYPNEDCELCGPGTTQSEPRRAALRRGRHNQNPRT